MLLTIHNLPADIRYPEIKTLLLSKCGLQNVILDNLTSEGNTKKVTVGVAEEEDAAFLVRKINGLYLNGQQLYVEDVRQKKSASEQPFRTMNSQSQQNMAEDYHNMHGKGMGAGVGNIMPAVQPMMAMYYVPAEYAQQAQDYGAKGWGMMGTQGFAQNQNYTMAAQNVQNPFMSAGELPQPPKASNFGSMNQFTKNQDYHQDKNHYEEGSSKSMYGRRPDEPAKWQSNDMRHQEASPARDRSQNSRDQSWHPRDNRETWTSRGGAGGGPRPEAPAPGPRRPPLKKNERAFGNVRPDFAPTEPTRNEFSGRDEFPAPFRSNDRPGFGRNDRSDVERERPAFGRPANRHDSERPNYRPEFGRPNVRPEFGHSSNQQQFGRPGKPEFRHSKPEFRPNKPEFRPNKPEFRPNKPEFRPNKPEFRPNKPDFRPNNPEFRPNKPDFRPNNPEFRPNKPEFGFGRGSRFDRGDSRPMPEPRKRRFDEALPIEAYVERPERLSRPGSRPLPSPPKSKMQRNEPNTSSNVNQANMTPKQLKLIKYTAWNNIMFDMIQNLRLGFPDKTTKQELKKLIKERFDAMLENKPIVGPQEAVILYRTKHSRASDMDAYNKILANIAAMKADEAFETDGNTAAEGPVGNPAASKSAGDSSAPKPAGNSAPANAPAGNPVPSSSANKPAAPKPAKKKKIIPLAPGQRVPSFPGGDKSLVAQNKREEKDGYIPFLELYYEDPIEEELNAIGKLLIDELKNADYENQLKVYNMINQKYLTGDVKQILYQHLARRISGEGLKVIRIIGTPRLPRRPELEEFLLRYGVISLKRSEKAALYTAAINNYENYDTLCNMDPVPIGIEGNVVVFKPFHLTAKPRADQKMLKKDRGKLLQTMVVRSGVNLLDRDWPAQEAAYKEKLAAEALLKEKQFAEAKQKIIAATEEREIAKAKEKEIAKAKEKEIAEAKEKEIAEAKEKEIADAQEMEIPEENLAEATFKTEKSDETQMAEVSGNTITANNDVPNDVLDNSKASSETHDYLHEDFRVIDEVNETDSDIECVAEDNVVVNIADDENNAAKHDCHHVNDADETFAAECEDDVEMDIDNVNEDDLEDY